MAVEASHKKVNFTASTTCEKTTSLENHMLANDKLVLQQNGIAARINTDLLVFKYFYFLFYGAVGTTFPFMGQYFRQIGLSDGQVMALNGVRPTIQLLFCPLWGVLGDRYIPKKMLVQFSLLIWLIMTISMAFLEPTDQVCQFVRINQTQTSVINSTTMKTGFFRKRRSDIEIEQIPLPKTEVLASGAGEIANQEEAQISGSGSITETEKESNTIETKQERPITEKTSIEKTNSRKDSEIKIQKRNELRQSPETLNQIFLTALFIILIIELFACPLLVLVDAVLLSKQNEENFSYGQQRVFGSLGYFTFFLIVGALLQNSFRQVCDDYNADFVICFCFFALITIITLVGTVKLPSMKHMQLHSGTRPSRRLISIFYNRHYVTLALYIIMMGFAHSLLENYFNSILMSSDVPYSSSMIINFFRFMGEPIALFFSSMILNRAGIINVLFGIPLVTSLNLFLSSFVSSHWHVIPLGFLDGWTYGISWVACATYLIGSAPDDCTATVQGCFQSAYWGLGNGFHLLIGTSLFALIGPTASLRLITIVALGTTVIFTFGLRDLHFSERNYYTVLTSKFERLFEGRVKCEVVPPSKGCGYKTSELSSLKNGDFEKKAGKKSVGAKKETKKIEKERKLDNL
ncbi:major facilitator superfamily domain-containing protein 6-A-like [Actinia tenebrosa]|uniref:Major facilitator superfamily domain-containing protein 6-A-like n=1 Tax=Actinia tenebrosa TaxID=6105 RepID=A0A6P8IK12_ACTTE|nr:major facilitator superfamily domain-containing protein 6-A-like [Actinia tenebrosa]